MSETNPRLLSCNVIKTFDVMAADCGRTAARLRKVKFLSCIENKWVINSFVNHARNRLEIINHQIEELNKYLRCLDE